MAVRLLISDSSVLIDMVVGGLDEAMFRLSWEFAVPDILFQDELSARHADLPAKGLQLLELSGEAILDAYDLRKRNRRLGVSPYDCMGVVLARREGCPLLAGDGALRTLARDEGVEVRGTLWVMKELFKAGLVDTARARAAYQEMKHRGSRLPWDQVEEQLERFANP